MVETVGARPGQYDRLLRSSIHKSLNLFAGEFGALPYNPLDGFTRRRLSCKILDEYGPVLNYVPKVAPRQSQSGPVNTSANKDAPFTINVRKAKTPTAEVVDGLHAALASTHANVNKLPYLDATVSDEVHLGIVRKRSMLAIDDSDSAKRRETLALSVVVDGSSPVSNSMGSYFRETISSGHAIAPLAIKPKRDTIRRHQPKWHPPWKLYRMIVGHQGWVHCVSVDVSNQWFATGSSDRLIKIWDLATCQLKLSLTGHINAVRDLKISDRHAYLFSCGEDNTVKCWDIEQNKVIRSYHGHLSGVYCLALHPALDVLFSGGRDAVVRVWDIRTKEAVHVLSGHSGTIMSLVSQNSEPQVISGSQDKTVRLWDLAAGKNIVTLTNHKKSVRALAVHPTEYTFCSAGADNVKVWKCPEGVFSRNLSGHNSILNCAAIKDDGESSMLVAGSNNGQLHFWDWETGYKFQTLESTVQKGSLESENGIFGCAFDMSETRLITAECDKTVKIWIQDPDATPETHPVVWKPEASLKQY
ncbi:WD domain G-beta repeat family protein [Babesia bovis T2Bo]|uniref:WD domain, G-beta repeat containing protein n=1 Tax=Babesia bovis TaxID=5865 RepID=A7AP41_BABBO|nr:WD domain G-beta repeat family protein [Babesia bovis T2Bo]EDO08325.1 WD domain G-beta repeat family protein [Babesia bovis T2Bo]|eukprot:XP_001611893.1 WD domain, G-beta repeat containing protein [Babesia bovis T2Bo]